MPIISFPNNPTPSGDLETQKQNIIILVKYIYIYLISNLAHIYVRSSSNGINPNTNYELISCSRDAAITEIVRCGPDTPFGLFRP